MLNKSTDRSNCQLAVETLESRFMLSTVSLNIAGQTGQEDFRVIVNDEVVLDAGAVVGGSDFSIEVADSIRAEDIRIEFTNDLYNPAEGFDRNLIVNFFALNETRFDFNDPGMFSSGTWRAEDGVTPGFGRGNVLHSNGFFQFQGEASDPQIEFGDSSFTVSRPFSDEVFVDGNELVLSGLNGPVSVYTEIDFEPGALSQITVEAWREQLTGQFDQIGRPWATTGINFYDNSGNLVDELQIEFNGDSTNPNTVKTRTLTTPVNATSAFVWAWVDGTSVFADIPLRLRDIQLETIDLSSDTTPPTIEQIGPASLFNPNSEATFAVEVTDDVRLAEGNGGLAPGAILVTGPNGFSQIAEPRTGFGDFVNSGTIIYGIVTSDGSNFSSADNGTYEIFLQEDRLTDAAGNVAPAQRVGTLEVSVTDPIPDDQPPTIRATVIDVPVVTGTTSAVQITARITDNVSPFPFPGRLTVFRADGFSQELSGIAGGFDQTTGENWELFQFRPGAGGFTSADNGEYFIRLEANQLVDNAGNAAPEQVLGSFIIDLPVAVA